MNAAIFFFIDGFALKNVVGAVSPLPGRHTSSDLKDDLAKVFFSENSVCDISADFYVLVFFYRVSPLTLPFQSIARFGPDITYICSDSATNIRGAAKMLQYPW